MLNVDSIETRGKPIVIHHVAVVVPVYQGQASLEPLVQQLSKYFDGVVSEKGHTVVISEVLLVHDCGPDRSDLTIEGLCGRYSQVRAIWLTKNFGQHAATLAGMSSSSAEWVVTLDEDGQHDPKYIASLLDSALEDDLQVVYANPNKPPAHGKFRNLTSRISKLIGEVLFGVRAYRCFNSFRLVKGEVARSLAAYCGHGVYLDVALMWVAGRIGQCDVAVGSEHARPSGYSVKRLLAHFWNMLLTGGTRPLRLITMLGFASVLIAIALSVFAIYGKLVGNVSAQGWSSMVIVVSFFSGCILLSLGLIAEYLAVATAITMGKPLYVIGSRRGGPN